MSELPADLIGLRFEQVLPLLRAGAWARRRAWTGYYKAIHIRYPDHSSDMALPYIFYRDNQGLTAPWVARHRDLLEGDWYVMPALDHEQAA